MFTTITQFHIQKMKSAPQFNWISNICTLKFLVLMNSVTSWFESIGRSRVVVKKGGDSSAIHLHWYKLSDFQKRYSRCFQVLCEHLFCLFSLHRLVLYEEIPRISWSRDIDCFRIAWTVYSRGRFYCFWRWLSNDSQTQNLKGFTVDEYNEDINYELFILVLALVF